MDTDKLNNLRTKTNNETQITMVEMADHCARPSTAEEYKKSG